MEMIKLIDNPVGKSRRRRKTKKTASTRRRRRTSRKATTRRRRRRTSVRGATTIGKRRRRRTVKGSNIIQSQTPKTTMGRRRRRTYRRKAIMGKATTRRVRRRRTMLGQGLSFNEITSDLLSVLSIGGGIIGGNMALGFVLPKVVEKPTVTTGLIGSAGLYALGYGLDYFMKPKGGVLSNLILGLKIAGIMNLAGMGILLLLGKLNMNSELTGVNVLSGVMNGDMTDLIAKQVPLLGASYLVDDTGDILPLGKGNFVGYSDDMALSRLDNQIDNLMGSAVGSPILNLRRTS